MDRTLTSWRTSAKERPCQGDAASGYRPCAGWIRRGDRYCRAAMPPHGEFGNPKWWRQNLCEVCAEFYGYPLPAVA